MSSGETISIGQPHWTVTLNHVNGDCETMPFRFSEESEAKSYGENWITEQSGEATYWTTKVDPPSYPVYKFGGRWICDGPAGRFHAKTKQQLIELMTNEGGLA